MSRLSLSFFGSPHIDLNGVPINLPRKKAIALLGFLGVTNGVHHRDTLATLLWPEYAQTQARTSLRITFSQLKRTLGDQWFDVQQQAIGLKIENGIWIDITHFFELLAQCTEHGHLISQPCPACLPILVDAVSLCRDEFMAGFTLRDSIEFDRWQEEQSVNLRSHLGQALQGLISGYHNLGQLDAAVRYTRQWLAMDSLQESAHQKLIQLYVELGSYTAAFEQYDIYTQTLHREMGLLPSPEMCAYMQKIRANYLTPTTDFTHPQREPPSAPFNHKQSALTSKIDNIGHNLPSLMPPFFGRQVELEKLKELLTSPQCRLITLVGFGGTGKTRLALQMASNLVQHYHTADQVKQIFSHGIYFIPLTPARSAGEILSTIAHFLMIPVHGRENLMTQLYHYLRQKQLLLVLDNLEHLLPEADILTEILRVAPGVKILTTSRERLGLPEEWALAIEGLEFPVDANAITPVFSCDWSRYSAIQLFLQRAQRLFPSYSPESEMAHIVKICQLLEGMPLGLELAASWIHFLSCAEICKEIEKNAHSLVSQQQDILPRHRSLRSVFEHSWALMTAEEQTSLCQLAIFSGGFTKEAAQTLGVSPRTLAGLLDRSLLQRRITNRYDMHSVVQQFATYKLQEMPDLKKQAQQKQAQYFADFLREREKGIKSDAQKYIFQEIGQEMGNIRLSWEWIIQQKELELLLCFLGPLSLYLSTRGLFHEGIEMYDHALQRLQLTLETKQTATAGIVVGSLLVHCGRFHYYVGDYQQAIDYLQKGLDLLKSSGARNLIPFALNCLGDIYRFLGDAETAQKYLEEGLAISRTIGDDWETARGLNIFGVLIARMEGPGEKAQLYFENSISLFKKVGDLSIACGILANLGIAVSQTGKYAEAESLLKEAIAMAREMENQHVLAISLSSLANVTYIKGEYDKAECFLQESYKINLEMGNMAELAICLVHFGALAYMQDTYDEARNYFEQSLHIRQEIGDKWGIINSLLNLADTTYRLKNYDECWNFCEQGQIIAQELGDLWSITDARVRMARCALALGAYNEARQLLYETLRCLDENYLGGTVRAFFCFARLCLHDGDAATAIKFLEWIANATCSSQEIKKDAIRLLTQMDMNPSKLSPVIPDQDETSEIKSMMSQVLSILKNRIDREVDNVTNPPA